MATHDHIIKQFDVELRELKDKLLLMAGVEEEHISSAMRALDDRDIEGAERIEKSDRQVNLLEMEVDEIEGLDPNGRETLLRLPGLRGEAAKVLEQAHELGGGAVERATQRLSATWEALTERGVSDLVQLDLSLLRDLGYYTGAIVEVYDPALGHILGGGGRYDDLLGNFGRPMPAAGFSLYLERVHLAQAEEERITQEQGR